MLFEYLFVKSRVNMFSIKKSLLWGSLIVLFVGSCVQASKKHAAVPAFVGAEGAGAMARGGRGGAVLFVTTLSDYDSSKNEPVVPGSLRCACETQGARTVIFRVSGIIALKSPLYIRNPFITVAGQSAPGDGICLKNHSLLISDTHDVIVRYLRCRPGDELRIKHDAITVSGSHNVIIDHCSSSWGTDEVLTVTGPRLYEVTVQWCFITEGLNQSVHPKGSHGYGSLIRADGNVSFHHNLYANHLTRCPRPGTYGKEPGIMLDFRNNVIYNWGAFAGYSADDPVRMNYVANYIKAGPSTRHRQLVFGIGGPDTFLFLDGNILEGNDQANADNWNFVQAENNYKGEYRTRNKVDKPFPATQIKTDAAQTAYENVLKDAGATLPKRDSVDQRIVRQIQNGEGQIIDSQKDVGGWPTYRSNTPPLDSDFDGMPDKWEKQNRLNPHKASDGNQDNDGDGYTNVEECLNNTNPNHKDQQVYIW